MQKKSIVHRWMGKRNQSDDVSEEADGLRFRGLEISVLKFSLAVVIVFGVFDIVEDFYNGSTATHVAIDTTLTLLVVTALGLLIARTRNSAAQIRSEFDLVKKGAQQAIEERQILQRGLGEYISAQLETWNLSAAEKEIALLLIKGLSHREIADLRSTSERTVRQQSQSIYAKAGLKGRTELSAYFLEDLLAPFSKKSRE